MNRKISLLLVVVPFALFGCDKGDAVDTTHTTGATAPAAPAATDNTAQNAQDRSGAVTPMDQGNDDIDLETTQQIRKALIADPKLSTDAKNVKIISTGGIVTLRGPVKSEAERAQVELFARNMAGADRVVDEIEVAGK